MDQADLRIMQSLLARQFLARASSSVSLYIVSLREMEVWVRCEKLFALRPCCNSHSDDGHGELCLLGSVSPRLRVVYAALCRKAGGRWRHTSPPKLGAFLFQTPPYCNTIARRTGQESGSSAHSVWRINTPNNADSHKAASLFTAFTIKHS